MTCLRDRQLNLPLFQYWPKYKGTEKLVKPGDRAIGTTFDYEGRDYQHEGMVVDVIFTFTDVFQDCVVTIEDDRGNDWECDADVVELVKESDA